MEATMDEVRFFGNESDLPRLKALRAERGWSVRRLAKEANLSPATVNEIELGKRRAQDGTVRKLTEALGVERVDLIFPSEQVRVWKAQDRIENEIIEQQLASMTDAEIKMILLDSPLLGRRVRAMVEQEQAPEE
jgi:transcriptional regulator with XRE-family HTH domain